MALEQIVNPPCWLLWLRHSVLLALQCSAAICHSARRDRAGLKRAVDLLKATVSRTIYLGGHAYGGYQASILVASEPSLVNGLMLLSYPLHPPRQPTQLRISHLAAVRTP